MSSVNPSTSFSEASILNALFDIGVIGGFTWFDIILCALALLVIFFHANKGAIRVLLENMNLVIGLLGGYFLSGSVFSFVWRIFNCEALAGEALSTLLDGVEGGLATFMEAVYTKYPILQLLLPADFDLAQIVATSGGTVYDVLYPYVESAISGVVRFGVFTLITLGLMTLVSALAPTLSTTLRRLPLFGFVDTLLGGVLGIVPASLLVLLLCFIPLLFVGLDAGFPELVLRAKIPGYLFSLFFGEI